MSRHIRSAHYPEAQPHSVVRLRLSEARAAELDNVVPFPIQHVGKGNQRLYDKQLIREHAFALLVQRKINHVDMVVMEYLMRSTDRGKLTTIRENSTIAANTRLSKRAVQGATSRLKAVSLLKITPRYTRTSRGGTAHRQAANLYEVIPPPHATARVGSLRNYARPKTTSSLPIDFDSKATSKEPVVTSSRCKEEGDEQMTPAKKRVERNQLAIDGWNRLAAARALRTDLHPRAEVRRELNATLDRLSERGNRRYAPDGLRQWFSALKLVAASKFWCGENRDNGPVTLSWLVKYENLQKVLNHVGDDHYDGIEDHVDDGLRNYLSILAVANREMWTKDEVVRRLKQEGIIG